MVEEGWTKAYVPYNISKRLLQQPQSIHDLNSYTGCIHCIFYFFSIIHSALKGTIQEGMRGGPILGSQLGRERRVVLTGMGLPVPTLGSTFEPTPRASLDCIPQPQSRLCILETQRIRWTLFLPNLPSCCKH